MMTQDCITYPGCLVGYRYRYRFQPEDTASGGFYMQYEYKSAVNVSTMHEYSYRCTPGFNCAEAQAHRSTDYGESLLRRPIVASTGANQKCARGRGETEGVSTQQWRKVTQQRNARAVTVG